MHGLKLHLGKVRAIADTIKEQPAFADILICLPATLIASAVEIAADLVASGGQDCHGKISGPFTGDVSAGILKDTGASALIVGHLERRQRNTVTDATVGAEANAARQTGLLAIICIGETEGQRRSGKALSVCADQIAGYVPQGTDAVSAAIAYETLWAIGTRRTPTVEEIAEMHAHIRQTPEALSGADGVPRHHLWHRFMGWPARRSRAYAP